MRLISKLIISVQNLILKSDTARKIIKNSSWRVSSSIFNMILGIFVIGIVARYFGPEKYGQLNYSIAFISLFTVVANLGLETLTIKSIVDKSWDEGTILCTSFILRIVGGIFLSVFAFLTIRIIEPNNSNIQLMVLLLSFSMIFKAFDVIEFWIQAYQKAKISSMLRMLAYIIFSTLKLLVVVFHGSIVIFSLVYLVDSLIFGSACLIVYLNIRENTSKWKFKKDYAVYILSQSWYLILSGLMISLYNRIDQVMLGAMLVSKSEAGIYSAAVTLAEIWYFVPMAIITSFTPIIIAKKKENQISYFKSIQSLYNIITFISISFCIFISLFSKIIVSILYGAAFIESANILIVLVWAGTFAMLGCCRSIWLVSEGLQKYSMFYTFIGCLVNIPINILLIPKFGAYGAAIATLSAQIANILALSFFLETKISTQMIFKSFSPVYIVQIVKKFINNT